MLIMTETRALRVLTELRGRLHTARLALTTDDVVRGELLTEWIDVLDDAIAEELRDLHAAPALVPP